MSEENDVSLRGTKDRIAALVAAALRTTAIHESAERLAEWMNKVGFAKDNNPEVLVGYKGPEEAQLTDVCYRVDLPSCNTKDIGENLDFEVRGTTEVPDDAEKKTPRNPVRNAMIHEGLWELYEFKRFMTTNEPETERTIFVYRLTPPAGVLDVGLYAETEILGPWTIAFNE